MKIDRSLRIHIPNELPQQKLIPRFSVYLGVELSQTLDLILIGIPRSKDRQRQGRDERDG